MRILWCIHIYSIFYHTCLFFVQYFKKDTLLFLSYIKWQDDKDPNITNTIHHNTFKIWRIEQSLFKKRDLRFGVAILGNTITYYFQLVFLNLISKVLEEQLFSFEWLPSEIQAHYPEKTRLLHILKVSCQGWDPCFLHPNLNNNSSGWVICSWTTIKSITFSTCLQTSFRWSNVLCFIFGWTKSKSSRHTGCISDISSVNKHICGHVSVLVHPLKKRFIVQILMKRRKKNMGSCSSSLCSVIHI